MQQDRGPLGNVNEMSLLSRHISRLNSAHLLPRTAFLSTLPSARSETCRDGDIYEWATR